MNKTKINEEMKSLRRVDLQVNRLAFNTTEAGASAERSHNLLSRYGEPGGSQDKEFFHVSDTVNRIFVGQYLNRFMPKEEFKKMFRSGK